MPPPGSTGRPAIGWLEVEAAAGTPLPPDYRAFVEAYGPGAVDGFLWVLHPATANAHLSLQEAIGGRHSQLWALRTLREGGEEIPYPIYPEPGGLLPWGITDNGDVCYWHTASADPAAWTVAANESRGPEWDDFRGTMVEFLVGVLSGRHRCPVFPEDFPSHIPTFRPYQE